MSILDGEMSVLPLIDIFIFMSRAASLFHSAQSDLLHRWRPDLRIREVKDSRIVSHGKIAISDATLHLLSIVRWCSGIKSGYSKRVSEKVYPSLFQRCLTQY